MSKEQKRKIGNGNRGIKRSQETLKKMSIAQKKRWARSRI